MTKLFAFGDSITTGAGATPRTKGFAYLLATKLGLTLNMLGASTAQAIDRCPSLMANQPPAGTPSVVFFSTNEQHYCYTDPATDPDAAAKNANQRRYFKDCMRAFGVRLAATPKAILPANGAVFSGPKITSGLVYGAYGLSATGSKVTLQCFGDKIALGFLRQRNNTSTFKVKIDGAVVGEYESGGDVRTELNSSAATQHALMSFVYSGLGIGSHLVEIEATYAAGAGKLVFPIFSVELDQADKMVAFVNQPLGKCYTNGGNDENTEAYNSEIASLVTELQGYGVDARLVDVKSQFNASLMWDCHHPNTEGHALMADLAYAEMT
ncbi:SGNH/GDSL hydrolase family protein [Agrobacterium rosae]|uniref:SGNH/GDSL hydrolase family protein n=1 Tax=Agrobacterium rosae TaxID=1972867 RepID=UPI002A1410B2|nr:SGNH/GDSL hydrolase family protein [Agrobacterium rosae]MDX8313322.1 hypothetical protein [Agrobacterium rosae]